MAFPYKQILCTLFLSIQIIGVCPASESDDATYHKALSYAKQGHYGKALTLLQPLADKHPKPNRYFYDYLSVLGWAENYEAIVQYERDIQVKIAPRYVLKNLAFAQRQQKLFGKAQQTYQVMVRRFPKFIDAKIGLSLVLIDQNKTEQAEEVLLPLYKRHPENVDLLYAMAYLRETERKPLLALPLYEKIVEIKPLDQISHKKRILTLNRLGASHLAYSLIEDPSIFSKVELARIRADMAAHRTRWGSIPPLQEKDRFKETDLAIQKINENIDEARINLGENSPVTLNNKFNQLVALRNRYRMEEVVTASNQLAADGITIPPYAQNSVCDALLYLERPDEAEKCYLEVILAGHANVNTKVDLFYAYLENEKFSEAQQWIKKVASEQPNVIRGAGKKRVLKGNPKKTQTETVKSLRAAFADDLDLADSQFNWLHNNASYNTNLRRELANIYYWRGWPRRAQEEYDIGLHQESKNLGLRLGLPRNQLALNEYRESEQSIDQLFARYPEDKGVAKQKKLWGIHNMREFRTDVSFARSSGGTFGSEGFNMDSYLFSAPLDYNYRAYLHHRFNETEFEEGDGLLNHAGIGLEYSAPDLLLTGELHHNRYENNRVGASVLGQYQFDDHLSSFLSLESLSRDTPLRALNQGIYAKSVSLGGQYRWHESRSAGLNLAYLDFSDGNKRESFSGFWSERWYNRYDYKLSTRIDLFSSKNSKKNTIYFNPERDFSSSIAFENDFLTWREYENSFYQRFIVSTGFYNQKNFSSGGTWALQYEHRWKARNRFELLYGTSYAKNLYDGDYEYEWNYYLTLDWRF
ncbi:MAG: poly-beta-1,6 N-acetyl-D-glucosamine export porin PgaA [Gammaproteobacteria bacterium]|nr:MAG: poly-beta-1,6 N-acetyl-D-glucosamine export porin PgaA [Gammaproteobacteria bacterium]